MAEGKGVIPYELIIGMESFILTPANDFWEKTEFFSELKQSVVNDNDYANSKYLYKNIISLSRHEQVCLSGLRFERYFSHHWAT